MTKRAIVPHHSLNSAPGVTVTPGNNGENWNRIAVTPGDKGEDWDGITVTYLFEGNVTVTHGNGGVKLG